MTSPAKTAAVGDAIAAALNLEATKTAFALGLDYTASFGYMLVADSRGSDSDDADDPGPLVVWVSPVEIEADRPGVGASAQIRTLALTVQRFVGSHVADRDVMDPPMALVDQLVEWLIKGDDAGQPRFFDTDTYCISAKPILGDHLNTHLNELDEFHVPVICRFRRTN